MEENRTQKKNILYLVVLILTLIVLIISATMAYFSLIASQKEEGTVLYTGTLEISYIDGTYIKNPTLYPMSNVTYDTKENVYRNTFSVRSTGTLDQTISIDLEVKENQFQANALRYSVYNSAGAEMDKGILPNSGKINLASNIYLAHGNTASYTIIIWWDENAENITADAGSIINGKIIAYAKQIKY